MVFFCFFLINVIACVPPGSCWSEGRRGPTRCCRTYSKYDFIKFLSIPSPILCSASILYWILGHVKQEAVSMVTGDHDHHLESKSQSSDTLTSPLRLLSFPGCHWREGPRWAGWRYWRARTARWCGSCWADGGERRASKIWNIANFVS